MTKLQNQHKNWKLIKNYGIDLKEYKRLLKLQMKKCRLCKRDASEFKDGLHVDHDHKTGKVRGLLCVTCNTALGYYEKIMANEERHKAFMEYLGISFLIKIYKSNKPNNHATKKRKK
jgi:hypothetical protein